MTQISIFEDSELDSESRSNPYQELDKQQTRSTRAAKASKSAAKRIAATAVQRIELSTPADPLETQPELKAEPALESAKWGRCRVCNSPIAIPGLDHSLCSNPARTCGSSGWVVDPIWLASRPKPEKEKAGKGGKANG